MYSECPVQALQHPDLWPERALGRLQIGFDHPAELDLDLPKGCMACSRLVNVMP